MTDADGEDQALRPRALALAPGVVTVAVAPHVARTVAPPTGGVADDDAAGIAPARRTRRTNRRPRLVARPRVARAVGHTRAGAGPTGAAGAARPMAPRRGSRADCGRSAPSGAVARGPSRFRCRSRSPARACRGGGRRQGHRCCRRSLGRDPTTTFGQDGSRHCVAVGRRSPGAGGRGGARAGARCGRRRHARHAPHAAAGPLARPGLVAATDRSPRGVAPPRIVVGAPAREVATDRRSSPRSRAPFGETLWQPGGQATVAGQHAPSGTAPTRAGDVVVGGLRNRRRSAVATALARAPSPSPPPGCHREGAGAGRAASAPRGRW